MPLVPPETAACARATPRQVKNILAIQYSQTGQLASVMDALLAPLTRAARAGREGREGREGRANVSVHREILRHAPGREYPYPWPLWTFMDTFPETVAGDPPPLAPLNAELAATPAPDFDLVIIGYPVWFLSPPPALTAFLRGDAARKLLRGRPVITVTACRNMWLMAQEKVKKLLRDIGARHCDHIALTDQGSAFATFITTPRWLLTGRKNAFLGLPPAGVPARDIAACSRFGRALLDALERDAERSHPFGMSEKRASAVAQAASLLDCPNAIDAKAGWQPALQRFAPPPLLAGLRACTVDTRLIASERIGIRSFRVWAKILRACGRPGAPLRRAMLFLYTVFLLTAIVTVVPASMATKALLRPFLRAKLNRLKQLYEQPSGSGTERLALFSHDFSTDDTDNP